MRRRISAMVGALVVLMLVGCVANPAPEEALNAESSPTAVPLPSPSPTPLRAAASMPSSCTELLGAQLEQSLIAEGRTFRPTDDAIQGRFSGIGNSADGLETTLSCAYDFPSGVDGVRYEFGVEMLTPSERDALLSVLRSGAGENTAGLTEEALGDQLRFEQVGAEDLLEVPADWTMTFRVYPDSWTMVWSPSGGEAVLERQREFSSTLELQLYAGP